MGPTPEQIALIRQYEPALFFSGPPGATGSERFFPSDAKRYLERAALHQAKAPFANRADWGAPIVAASQLGAIDREAPVFIGKKDPSASPQFPLLQTKAGQEHFLDVSGWSSNDTRIDIDKMASLYSSDPVLKNSQFWYHAEFFDAARLRRLFTDAIDPGGSALNFNTLFDPRPGQLPVLNDPALICYYLFYPAHEESLSGCEVAPGQIRETAKDFASFAGEWSCFALLLDRSNASPSYAPKWAGLTNRNLGNTGASGEEVRTTMRLLPWSAMALYGNDHAQLNVGLGSHGLYVLGEQLPPLTFDDPSTYNCGGASDSDLFPPPEVGVGPKTTWSITVLLGKLAAGSATGFGILGGIGSALGAGAGLVWGIAEWGSTPPAFGEYIPAGASPGARTTDTVGTNGLVVHPAGLLPPNVDPSRAVEWQSADDREIGGRKYFYTVDRATQVLWGDDPDGQGYTGRWGADVAQQPQNRRSGMRFPKFWQLFFETLVRNDPPARTIFLTTKSAPTWIVPADWNSAANSIECIGGGGGGGGGNTANFRAGGGGGGGEYRKATNLALTPGASISYVLGLGGDGGVPGSDGAAGGSTSFDGNVVVANGGGGGGTLGTAGRAGIGGAGPTFNSGGDGGSSIAGTGSNGGGGGGGAGGPLGSGGKGGDDLDRSGGGGGANGGGRAGSPSALGSLAGGDGGNNRAAAGGGLGATADGTPAMAGQDGGGGGGGAFVDGRAFGGGDGGSGSDIAAFNGSGGGGGGACSSGAKPLPGGAGGNFGGGGGGGPQDGGTSAGKGGNGGDGVIVIRYTPPF